jgi:hypothetical protein
MDASQFDRLTRRVSAVVPRRGALAAVLVPAFLSLSLGAPLAGKGTAKARRKKAKSEGKGKKKRKGKGKGKRKNTQNGKNTGNETQNPSPPAAAVTTPCYPSLNCTPGQGKINQDCNFAKSTLFRDQDARGAVLIGSNFTQADLSNADLRGAVLNGACLADAVLLDAQIDSSTVLGDAIHCHTIMPDGTIDNSGCNRVTPCCPLTCEGAGCGPVGSAPPCTVCPSGCPYDSLAAAVAGAASGDTILLCAGDYHTVGVTIGKNLIIAGAGTDPASTVLDGGGAGQVLTILQSADATILNLTVSGGRANLGGGIGNAGTLRLVNVTVKDSEATGSGSGGGIFNSGNLLMQSGCYVKDNAATNGGGIANTGSLTLQSGSTVMTNTADDAGGILAIAGTVTIQDGTVTGNTAALNGGGITNNAGARVELHLGSLVSANSAALNGGGIANSGTLTMESGSSVLANMAANGAGIANLAGTAALQEESLVSGNTAQQEGGGIFLIGGTVTLPDELTVINNIGSNTVNNCRPQGAVAMCVG